jgi:hypothetical protein
MKNFLSCIRTVVILFIVTILSLGFYTFVLARPISYGMSYYNNTVYENEEFEGRMKFYSDSTMLNKNSTFNDEFESYYYYKNGYIFNTAALTDEAYEKEVEYINNNFEIAVKTPFYANKINAFKMTTDGAGDYALVYTCKGAVVFAIVGGIVELAVIGFAVASVILYKKSK